MEGSQKIASQTPIDVYSGDEGARASETCMKDAEIMRQNARFRSSWEPGLGGDLIPLTPSLEPRRCCRGRLPVQSVVTA